MDNITNHNATYKLFYDAIKNWNCSAEFNNIKDFALNQIDISKDSGDYYKDVLSQKMLTKEEFISNNKYKEELLKNTKQGIDYHQEQLDNTIKKMKTTMQMSCLKRCSQRRNLFLEARMNIRKNSLSMPYQISVITRRS